MSFRFPTGKEDVGVTKGIGAKIVVGEFSTFVEASHWILDFRSFEILRTGFWIEGEAGGAAKGFGAEMVLDGSTS